MPRGVLGNGVPVCAPARPLLDGEAALLQHKAGHTLIILLQWHVQVASLYAPMGAKIIAPGSHVAEGRVSVPKRRATVPESASSSKLLAWVPIHTRTFSAPPSQKRETRGLKEPGALSTWQEC